MALSLLYMSSLLLDSGCFWKNSKAFIWWVIFMLMFKSTAAYLCFKIHNFQTNGMQRWSSAWKKNKAAELLICSVEQWSGCNSTALHTIVELPPESSWNLVQPVGMGEDPLGAGSVSTAAHQLIWLGLPGQHAQKLKRRGDPPGTGTGRTPGPTLWPELLSWLTLLIYFSPQG